MTRKEATEVLILVINESVKRGLFATASDVVKVTEALDVLANEPEKSEEHGK